MKSQNKVKSEKEKVKSFPIVVNFLETLRDPEVFLPRITSFGTSQKFPPRTDQPSAEKLKTFNFLVVLLPFYFLLFSL